MSLDPSYLEKLKKRAKESHVYRSYQLAGLEIAEILGDEKHKALYIKLAKERDVAELRRIAKTVAERRDVKNKGAYFMSCLPAVVPPSKGGSASGGSSRGTKAVLPPLPKKSVKRSRKKRPSSHD